MSKKWETRDDDDIRYVWECTEVECEVGNPQYIVSPAFYERNGEPMCVQCGIIMTYLRTEVRRR